MSKINKRISVFDRLGPGNDESTAASHRRYSSEKHVSSSGGQEKVRGLGYGPSVPSSHVRLEDRENPPIRDRKSRHRGPLGEYPTSLADGEILEDKRTPIPPPMKSSRDQSEALKSIGVKVSRGVSGPLGSGESDYESGEEGKRRKGYRGEHDVSRRGKHGSDVLEEDSSSRRSSRLPERKEKLHGGHSERPSSGLSHKQSPTIDTVSKTRSWREGVVGPHEHKRRKEEEPKTPSELGHKRKREHIDDINLPEVKKPRHGDHHGIGIREMERHHSNSSRELEHHHLSTSKESDHHHGSMERKRRQEETSLRKHQRSRSPKTPVQGERGKSKSYKHNRDSKKSTPEDREHSKTSEGAGKTKSLDWMTVSNFTEKASAKLKNYPRTVMERLKPGSILSEVEVSPELAGPECYQKIVEVVSLHLREGGRRVQGPWSNLLEGKECIQKAGVDWDSIVSESMGPCRRALTASRDYALRRLLRKGHRGFLPTARSTPASWDSEHSELGFQLYQLIPSKPTGKPAFRLHPSKVGTLLL